MVGIIQSSATAWPAVSTYSGFFSGAISLSTTAPANADPLMWAAPYGGTWNTASNWLDTSLAAIAAAAPSSSTPTSIAGGTADQPNNIAGIGAAAEFSVTGNALLWGTLAVAGGVTIGATGVAGELDLDGGANLTAASLSGVGATLNAADASSANISGGATLANSVLIAASGSTLQFGSLSMGAVANGFGWDYGTVAVDAVSSITVGTAISATLGALTIGSGQVAALSGMIEANVALPGTLAIEAGMQLTIGATSPFSATQTISGAGLLTIGEASQLILGAADSAAISFTGPDGTLTASALPTGTISGFTAGDVIELVGLATGLSYTQTTSSLATLTLLRGGAVTGALKLAGNYTGDRFHMRLDIAGDAFISEQIIGAAPIPPSIIPGTPGFDMLSATANNQILTGYGGGDIISGGTFTGLVFRDTSGNLTGTTLSDFVAGDQIDLTDINATSVSVSYDAAASTVTVNDGTRAATMTLSLAGTLPAGAWTTASDGSGGTTVQYGSVNTDEYIFVPTYGANWGSAANWQDTTTGASVTVAAASGNAVTIPGGGTSYTDVTGNGSAGSLTTSGDVLLFASVNVGTAVTGVSGNLIQNGTLAVCGGTLTLAGTAMIGGVLEGGNGAKATASALEFTTPDAAVMALNGSSLGFAGFTSQGSTLYPPAILAVDAASALVFGSTASVVTGALNIGTGVTSALSGTVEGNVAISGILEASGQPLTITSLGTQAALVSGSGTLMIAGDGMLVLDAADSAALQFSQTGGTLALGTIMPSGTITGFAAGDAIAVGALVTSLSYTQNGADGALSLLDGATTLGTLTLAGTYSAAQFVLDFTPTGTPSVITYAATPTTTTGNQISTGTDSYSWTNTSGGDWTNTSNWTDSNTGSVATATPSTGNVVVISDNPGTLSAQIISGFGAAARIDVYAPASTVFTGTVSDAGQFYASGQVALQAGARFTVGNLSDYGAMLLTGASTLVATGASGGTEIVGALDVVNASHIETSGALFDIAGGSIGVDASSSVEDGSSGSAAAGSLTIDAGQQATIEERGTIAADLVVNGLLVTTNATIEGFGGGTGTVSGGGTIQIGSAIGTGHLILQASDTTGLRFYGPGDSLELRVPSATGPVAGFVTGDTIQVDHGVTGASFTQTSAGAGVLTLTEGVKTVGTIALAGTFSADFFQVDIAGPGGAAVISLLPAAPTTNGSATASTGQDAYSWSGPSSGSWTTLSNWTDTTTGGAPTAAPGLADNVTITGPVTIGGTGQTRSLTIDGRVVLTGWLNATGYLTVGASGGQPGNLDIEGTNAFFAASVATISGTMAVSAATARINNTATLASGNLMALDGAAVQLGGLASTGTTNLIAVDPGSSVGIGTQSAIAGTMTQAAGTNAAFSGTIYGVIIANGTLAVPGGGNLSIDIAGTIAADPYGANPTITGSGQLTITEGGTLALGAVSAVPIVFNGPNATLSLAALPSAMINHFTVGDRIQIDETVTGLTYTQLTSQTGALTLTDGTSTVGVLELAGSYTGDTFQLDMAPDGSFATITLQTLGVAATPPTLIAGTWSADTLTATAAGQTLIGGGGPDTLNIAGIASVTVKDTTANLNGYTIVNFGTTDRLDFTDLNPTTGWVRYTPAAGILSATDGIHSANFSLGFTSLPATGTFSISSDGAGGSDVTWIAPITVTATAAGQILTGSGGAVIANAGGFASVVVRDTTANINSYTIQNFTTTDTLDLTDLNEATAWIRYSAGTDIVSVSDGIHSANFKLSFITPPTTGGFTIGSDGASGSDIAWNTATTMTATAAGQTLTGNGSADTMNAAGFASVTVKDTTANMNSDTVINFTTTDRLDLTDLNPATAWVRYSATNIVSISDGVHSANFSLSFVSTPTSGAFTIGGNGASGSYVTWA